MQNRERSTSNRQEPLLSHARQEELRQALTGSPFGGGVEALWTARAVAAWMSEPLGRPGAVQRGWDYLQRLRPSPQVPPPRHVQADPPAPSELTKKSGRSSRKWGRPFP